MRTPRLARMIVTLSMALALFPPTAAAAVPARAHVSAGEPPVASRSPLVQVAGGRLLAPDIARIVNQGELVVAMAAADTPPFFSVKSGTLVGIDVDLSRRIAAALGVPVRFDRRARNPDGVADAVAAGQADLGISRLARTLERAQIVHFSDTYMRLAHALLINRTKFAALAGDQPLPQVIRNFSGTIGVLGNSSWEEFGKRNFPKAKLVSYPSFLDAVKAARRGEVVAAYRDELEVMQTMRDDPALALALRTVTFSDLESSLSVMVGVGDPTLLSFVNEVIAQWADKPTVSSMLKPIK